MAPLFGAASRANAAIHDYFPLYTVGGKWKHDSEVWTNWCEGFLGGMLWIIYRHAGDAWWRERAQHYSRLIEHRKTDREVHHLGFLFIPTWKAWYDLGSDSTINQVVIDAEKTLALRFQPKGRYLRSFVSQDSIFIDIMTNVGIIFYAACQTKDASLLQIAVDHCLTTRRFLVRGDASTSQANNPTRMAQRFELGTWTNLGYLRFHDSLSIYPRR